MILTDFIISPVFDELSAQFFDDHKSLQAAAKPMLKHNNAAMLDIVG